MKNTNSSLAAVAALATEVLNDVGVITPRPVLSIIQQGTPAELRGILRTVEQVLRCCSTRPKARGARLIAGISHVEKQQLGASVIAGYFHLLKRAS